MIKISREIAEELNLPMSVNLAYLNKTDAKKLNLPSKYGEIREDGYAEFQFGVVEGGGQYGYTKDGKYVDFDWEGSSECDEASGEFELEINGDKMTGTISFNDGDESGLTAIREKS